MWCLYEVGHVRAHSAQRVQKECFGCGSATCGEKMDGEEDGDKSCNEGMRGSSVRGVYERKIHRGKKTGGEEMRNGRREKRGGGNGTLGDASQTVQDLRVAPASGLLPCPLPVPFPLSSLKFPSLLSLPSPFLPKIFALFLTLFNPSPSWLHAHARVGFRSLQFNKFQM